MNVTDFPQQLLTDLILGEPMSLDDLTVYPVLGPLRDDPGLVDLDEALAEGWIEVSEITEAGSVPELAVVNLSPHRIILFDGEELIGAKQNRIVNVTIIVGPFSKLVIPVSCVEQGRWSWTSSHFTAGEFLYPSLRRDKFERVGMNLRTQQSFRSDQGMIWGDIAAKSARMGVQSSTGSMRDLGASYFVDDTDLQRRIDHRHDQVGYVALIRNGFAGGDIFPSPGVSARKFYKLLRAYLLDSRDPQSEFPSVQVETLVSRIRASRVEAVESIGEGQEFRFQDDGLQGSLTLVGNDLAHLAVFPATPPRFRRPLRRPYAFR